MSGDAWDPIFDLLGIRGANVIVTFVFVSMICNFVARIIPNDATGWRGAIRSVARVVGLYASSRITSGVTIEDVVHNVARVAPPVDAAKQAVEEVSERIDERIEEVVEHVEDVANVIPAFPRFQREQDSSGRYKPLQEGSDEPA